MDLLRNNEGEELAKAALGLQRLKMTFLAKEMLTAIFVLIPNSSSQHAPIFSYFNLANFTKTENVRVDFHGAVIGRKWLSLECDT